MGYRKAADVLPKDLMEQVQRYIDGAYLYIPRREDRRRAWGAANGRREETRRRDLELYRRYLAGTSVNQLAEDFFLAPKSVQKILARLKHS